VHASTPRSCRAGHSGTGQIDQLLQAMLLLVFLTSAGASTVSSNLFPEQFPALPNVKAKVLKVFKHGPRFGSDNV